MRAQSTTFSGRAAAFGGTTTFIDFALQKNELSLIGAIEEKQEELKKDTPDIDYALHAMITGEASLEVLDEIPSAIAGGVSSFKMFTTFSGGSDLGGYAANGETRRDRNGALRGRLPIEHCVHKLYRGGCQAAKNIFEARPSICEEAAINRMLLLSKRTGSPLYTVHVSSVEGMEAIAEAKGKRLPVYGEALHNYLAFCNEHYAKPNGTIYHNYPGLKSPKDRAALWEGLRSGVLDVASSDDFTIPFASKISGKEVDNALGGHNGIETRMAYMFSEGVKKGRINVNRFVEVSSTAIAKLFGLYPRKGAIAIGSDADIVLIDPNRKQTVRLADLHSNCDYSIWDGWEFEGIPSMTMLRGNILVEDGRWTGPPGIGQFIASRSPEQP
jgi:dihydropyrimidinase